MKKIIALLVLLPALAFGQGTDTPLAQATGLGVGTSQAGANNAGNAQQLSLVSNGATHETIQNTPNVQGNAFYGSASPDGCAVSQGGGAAGWLIGFNVLAEKDVWTCIDLRVYERTMQWVVRLPETAPDGYTGMTRAQGMEMASDELCMVGDRQRALMEAHGRCKAVHDIPTYDHLGWDSDARAFDRKYAADHPSTGN